MDGGEGDPIQSIEGKSESQLVSKSKEWNRPMTARLRHQRKQTKNKQEQQQEASDGEKR